jgi:N-acetylglucosaminyl-diphospho-decaprenol L-rhamnosyltransferase
MSDTLFDKVTIVIVTFKSSHIINKCLDNLDIAYKKIIVENSNDVEFTNKLEAKYKNLKCINIGFDSGFGFAVNRAVEQVETDYFVCMNPDSFPNNDCISLIFKTISDTKCAIVTPITYIKNLSKEFNGYGFFCKKNKQKKIDNILKVDWVHGNVFIMKKDLFYNLGKFDENIFLNFEETDLQKRIFDQGLEILINFNAKSSHLEGKSAEPKFSYQMKCEAAWHFAWSKFYFYKKHYNFYYSFFKSFPDFLNNFLKLLIFYFFNKRKAKIFFLSIEGFFHAVLNKPASYRADII